jgi:predicted deacetylase
LRERVVSTMMSSVAYILKMVIELIIMITDALRDRSFDVVLLVFCQVEDENTVKKYTYFGGVDHSIRKQVSLDY